MSVKMRQIVEHEIAEAVVAELLKADYALLVDIGDGETAPSVSWTLIIKELFAGDDARLYAHKDGKYFGWVYFVFGNDGWDVISDYTTNLTKFIERGAVATIVDKYSD